MFHVHPASHFLTVLQSCAAFAAKIFRRFSIVSPLPSLDDPIAWQHPAIGLGHWSTSLPVGSSWTNKCEVNLQKLVGESESWKDS